MKSTFTAFSFAVFVAFATLIQADDDPPTSLSYSENAPRYTMGMGITMNRPTVGGGQANLVYTIETGTLPFGVSLGSTGNIYGAPLETGDFAPKIRATNGGGFAEVTLNMTVRTAAPVVSYTPNTFDFPLGTPIVTQTPVNAGGAALSWSISPNLTAATGLLFNTATGRISGTPVYATALSAYTVTATGFGGAEGQAIVGIATTVGAPTVVYDEGPYTLTAGSPIVPVSKTSATGNITHYSIFPVLPAGLQFNTTTGRVIGTPAATAAMNSYTVTAHGPGGTASDNFLLEVLASAAPDISYPMPEYFFPVASEIAPVVPVKAGGPITSWSVSLGNNLQTLEANTGLRFNTTTGKITGTPTKISSGIFYTITAHGIGASQDGVTLLIETTPVAPDISYSGEEFEFAAGSEIPAMVPVKGGGPIVSWSISPGNNGQTLEANTGLRFNTTTGKITGAPTKVSSGVFYSVTAHGLGVSQDDAVLFINITAAAPTITYNHPSTLFAPLGAPMTPLIKQGTTGIITHYSINPPLPSGVTLNTTTGTVSGTPTSVAISPFTITAHGPGGTGSDVVTMNMTASLPNLTFPASPYTFVQGDSITPFRAVNSGGPVLSWSISTANNGQTLTENTGLSFNTITGRIFGTATTVSISRGYIVTANGWGGTTGQVALWVGVNAVPGKRGVEVPEATSFRVSGASTGYTMRLPTMDPAVEKITVSVTDLSGRMIWSRNVDPHLGIRAIAWDGKSTAGHVVSAGMYLARITTKRAHESAEQIGKGLKVVAK
jgi:hypothetical protein